MRRSTSPLTTLQVAATVSALLFAPLPAFAQGAPAPAPTPPAAAPPASAPAAPKPAAAPKTPPPPSSESRVPGSDIPTEAAPLPPWQPTPEPPVTAPPTDTPPAGTGTPEPPPVGTPPVGAPPETSPPATEGPAPAPAPTPVDPVKANKLRVAGIGTMIAGGVLSLAGFAMIIGFSVRGNKFEEKLVTVEDKYSEEGCSGKGGKECDAILVERTDIRNGILFSDYYTKLAGAGLAAGLLVTAIGGIVYRRGMKGLSNNVARVRVSPSFGGLSISGRF